jgi:uncharacterized protein with HEPN domain
VRSDPERLRDILDAIDQIRRYSSKVAQRSSGTNSYRSGSSITWRALGEAVARLSPSIRRRRSVPWNQIIGMRNILVHEYFRIDPETVWTAVEHHLPPLEIRVRTVLAELEEE